MSLTATPSPALRQATAALLAAPGFTTPLPWAALRVSGPDALTFLQGQVTCDLREVDPARSRLGCLLSLKGRIQASFRVLAISDGYLLLLPAAQLAAAQARLGKYAVFSKVTLAPATVRVTGLAGAAALAADAAPGDWPLARDEVTVQESCLRVRLAGLARGLRIDIDAAPGTPDDPALAAWQVLEIASGEILVDASEHERFQPQEIDYHLLQGVSYQKGCYLGQEIVARLYFRGQLKSGLQHLRLQDAGTLPVPGQVLRDGEATVGEVVRVACPDAGQVDVLALVRHDSGPVSVELDGRPVALQRIDLQR